MTEGAPEAAPAAAAPPEAADTAPPVLDPVAPHTRDEALNRLRGDAAELRSARAEEIAAESISRVRAATHVNVFHNVTVEGDLAAGTKVRRGAARGAKVRLNPDTVHEDYAHYVRPDDLDRCVDLLDLRHLLIIADRARTGRDGRANAVMVEILRRNHMDPAYVELGSSALGNMSWRPPERECAYVVRDAPNSRGTCAAESLSDAWLDHAATQAREAESYLVVVTGPVRGSLASAANRADFVLTDLDLPDPRDIVRKRVLLDVGWMTESEVDSALAETELVDILDERDDPRFATRAAKAIAETLRQGNDVKATVARLRDPNEQVREWLAADPDASEIALVLATATLEGCSYLSITDAAVALFRKLSGSGTAMTPRYLRTLLAERSWIDPVDKDGIPVARFRHSELRNAVLASTWFELDGARESLLDWLTDLAGHHDVEIRARAASTTGILAAQDLEYGFRGCFLPWAAGKSPVLRQSAATGLNVAGTVSGQPEVFWQHVERWAELVRYDDSAKALPATAGLAAGGPLGGAAPGRALKVLRTLIHDGGWDLLEPIAVSVHLLLSAGQVGPVMAALLDWTDGQAIDEVGVKALTVFAFAASEDVAAGCPTLLAARATLRDELPEMWGRALDCEPVRSMATDALRAWVRQVDVSPSTHDDVLDVLAGVADRGDQDYARVCHFLDLWAHDPDHPSDSAARFLNELLSEGELLV